MDESSGIRVQGSGCKGKSSGSRVEDSRNRVQGSKFGAHLRRDLDRLAETLPPLALGRHAERVARLVRQVLVRVVNLGRSTCHAISGRGGLLSSHLAGVGEVLREKRVSQCKVVGVHGFDLKVH